MFSSVLRFSVALIAWGGCLVGSLSLAEWPGDFGHAICGPWGCGPPLQALIACHIAWLVSLTPPAVLLIRSRDVSAPTRRLIGSLLTAMAVAALLAILAEQWLVWLPQASQWQRTYFWQRYEFSIVTAVDFPIVQLLLLGLMVLLSCRSRGRAPARCGADCSNCPCESVIPSTLTLQNSDRV